MEDTYRHKGLRNKLVDSIRKKGFLDEKILKAITILPRHYFMETAFDNQAYQDRPFSIGCNQTISQPSTVANQTKLLDIKKGDKILEIGTGSGYQAAILSILGANVYTIERHEELYIQTNKLLKRLDFNQIKTFWGDGYEGLPKLAPFDKILVTAGATIIPKALFTQLKIGGLLVIPVGDNKTQEMLKITKLTETDMEIEENGSYRFVPFESGINKI